MSGPSCAIFIDQTYRRRKAVMTRTEGQSRGTIAKQLGDIYRHIMASCLPSYYRWSCEIMRCVRPNTKYNSSPSSVYCRCRRVPISLVFLLIFLFRDEISLFRLYFSNQGPRIYGFMLFSTFIIYMNLGPTHAMWCRNFYLKVFACIATYELM